MKVGDCHYHLKEYAEAIASYEEFKKVHPTYEEMPYIQFQLGMCYFSQMTTADRDQSSTQKAMANFEYLIANYPPNLFTEKAKEKVSDCQRQLAEHEFHIGNFYYLQEKFQAAALRFEGLLEKYPKWLDQDKTLFLLGNSYIGLDKRDKAGEALTRLVKEYPGSPLAKEAKKMLARGLIGKKTALRKGKAPLKAATPEPGSQGLVLVRYEEEGKKTLSSEEDRVLPAQKFEEQKGVAQPEQKIKEEKAGLLAPREDANPLPSAARPAEEGRTKAVPERKIEQVPGPSVAGEKATVAPPAPSEELKIALVPGEEPSKSLPPARVEPRPASKPEEEKPRASLPGILGLPTEREKPKKEATSAPLQEAKLADMAYPIDITSDRVETYTKENLILFKGNVMARQKDIVIYADSVEAVVIDNGKGIEKVTAGGNVKIQQGLRVANCEKAIFYNLDKKVVLTGEPKVWEGDNFVSGEEIVFDIEKDRIEVKGGTAGRGKVRVFPKEEPEKKE